MIARTWRGWAIPENADAYEAHFRTSGSGGVARRGRMRRGSTLAAHLW